MRRTPEMQVYVNGNCTDTDTGLKNKTLVIKQNKKHRVVK